MSKKIVIFTLNGCHHCQSLKNSLNDLSIQYNEIEVSTEEGGKIFDTIVKETGKSTIPTVIIIDESTNISEVYVPDLHFHSEDEIIQIIKSNL
jgi:glutaredoxin